MYNKEEMKIMNMKKVSATDFDLTRDNAYKLYNVNSKDRYPKIYKIETELDFLDKLKFIDEVRDGIGTYMANVLIAWETEKNDLPKDSYGAVKTVSKKAWLKRNDKRHIIDDWYKYGTYRMFGTEYGLGEREFDSLVCRNTTWGNVMLYSGEKVFHQWFHDFLNELEREEIKYFKSIDSKSIKLAKINEYGSNYRIGFDNKRVDNLIWNNKGDFTEKELDYIIEAYEKLEKTIKTIGQELNAELEKQEQER